MVKPKVYVTSKSFGRYCREALELVKSVADIEMNPHDRPMTEGELLKTVKDVEGLIVSTDNINRKVFERAEKLKIIARHGVGVDNIDLKTATEKSIVVTYTPHVNAESVADFTVGLMLSVARRIPQANVSTKQGIWEAKKFMGMEVHGKTLGIIGLGSIGTGVARRAKGFDMRILYYDQIRKTNLEKELGVKYVDLKTLLRESDVVTVHVTLTDETKGMIGEEELNLMKKTAFLVNAARGPIVEEGALYKALKEEIIAGAALDVYAEEPPGAKFPMFKLDNVVATPHIASYTLEAVSRMDMMNAEDLARFFKGEKPIYMANPEVLKKLGKEV